MERSAEVGLQRVQGAEADPSSKEGWHLACHLGLGWALTEGSLVLHVIGRIDRCTEEAGCS